MPFSFTVPINTATYSDERRSTLIQATIQARDEVTTCLELLRRRRRDLDEEPAAKSVSAQVLRNHAAFQGLFQSETSICHLNLFYCFFHYITRPFFHHLSSQFDSSIACCFWMHTELIRRTLSFGMHFSLVTIVRNTRLRFVNGFDNCLLSSLQRIIAVVDGKIRQLRIRRHHLVSLNRFVCPIQLIAMQFHFLITIVYPFMHVLNCGCLLEQLYSARICSRCSKRVRKRS